MEKLLRENIVVKVGAFHPCFFLYFLLLHRLYLCSHFLVLLLFLFLLLSLLPFPLHFSLLLPLLLHGPDWPLLQLHLTLIIVTLLVLLTATFLIPSSLSLSASSSVPSSTTCFTFVRCLDIIFSFHSLLLNSHLGHSLERMNAPSHDPFFLLFLFIILLFHVLSRCFFSSLLFFL